MLCYAVACCPGQEEFNVVAVSGLASLGTSEAENSLVI